MTERTTQQLERDLDTFWNELVAAESPLPESAETAMAARLATLDSGGAPRTEFLDDLWTQLRASEANGHLDELLLPDAAATVVPAAPVAMRPPRPELVARSRLQRWGKLAAAIAALLAVAAVGAILFANRQQRGPTPVGQPWSMTGGNPGKTNANSAGSPIAVPTVHWRVETNGRIDGAPVVLDATVYIGNGNSHFYAIDVDTGLIRWDTNLRKPVTQTAAISDNIVVVITSTSLYGLDIETGEPLWQREDLVAQSAPVIAGNTIYLVDADNQLRALSLESGADAWSSDAFTTPPAFAIDVARNRLIATTPQGAVSAISTDDGASLWDIDPGLGALGTPLVDGDRVFVPISGGVSRFDGKTGELVRKNVLGFAGIPTLALAGSQLVASTDAMVVSYDRDTLEVQWTNQTLSGLTGGLSAGSASMYLSREHRTLTALDRTTGDVQWTVPLDEVAQLAPVVTESAIFLATRDGAVYAIGDGSSSVLHAPTASPPEEDNLANVRWLSTGGPNALQNPTGIAVSPSGEIWVCDTANDRLQVFTPNGAFLRNFGGPGSAPGQFDFGDEVAAMDGNSPLEHHCSLDFDASGALYVADAANHRVQRFPVNSFAWLAGACCAIEIDGTPYPFPESVAQPDLIIGSEGTGNGQFLFASDVAVAPNGDIYVGDRYRIDVQRFDRNGAYLETIGKPIIADGANQPIVIDGFQEPLLGDPLEPGVFFGIDGLAIDAEGRLYIADDKPQVVARLEPDGSWTIFQLSRRDYRINGIAVDDRGNLFVAQIATIGGGFMIYGPDGTPIGQVGTYGNAPGEFDATTGLALDDLGNIFVTDWAANRVQKLQLDYEHIDASGNNTDGESGL